MQSETHNDFDTTHKLSNNVFLLLLSNISTSILNTKINISNIEYINNVFRNSASIFKQNV